MQVAVPTWVAVANIVLLSLYSVEICVRFLVYKSLYFRSAWNLLDLGVVTVDVASHILRRTLGTVPSLSVLRTVRLVRLARAYKVLVVFPELYAMIIGMFSTIKTIFWGMLLLEGHLDICARTGRRSSAPCPGRWNAVAHSRSSLAIVRRRSLCRLMLHPHSAIERPRKVADTACACVT